MGYLFRWFVCRGCQAQQRVAQRKKPRPCHKCGSTELLPRPKWYVCLRVRGRQFERGVGTEALAAKTLRTWEHQAMEGKLNLKKAGRFLFREFVLNDWWQTYAQAQLSESTRRDYWNRLQQRILPRFGHLFLDQVSRKDIEGWLARLVSEGLSAASTNKFHAIMQSIFTRAVEWGDVDEHPMQGIKKMAIDNRRVRYLTPDEYQRLIDFAGNEMLRGAIALAVGTGLRRSALFGLRWSHIDLTAKTITIPASLSKSRRQITIPINSQVLNVLSALPRGLHMDFVLHKRRGEKYRDMRSAFERAVAKAGLEDFHWHDLRHTFASWHTMAGTDPLTLQELMGLNSLAMVERYSHLSPDHVRKQAENISIVFGSSMGNRREIAEGS